MANHPNRKRLYAVAIQSWANNGLGWERISNDLGGIDGHHGMTREQAETLARDRKDIETTSVNVYRGDGDLAADAGRGEVALHWY